MRKPLFPLSPLWDQYYPNETFSEFGSEGCDELQADDILNDDVRNAFQAVESLPIRQVYLWFLSNKDSFSPSTLLWGMKHNGRDPIRKRQGGGVYDAIFVQRPLHTVYELDNFLADCNHNLSQGGYLVCCCRTSSVKKKVMYSRYPKPINRIYYGLHYLWHRVCPKLKITKPFYFWVTKGNNRTFHRVEILGRLYHAGFEVVYESTPHGEFRVIARKAKDPITVGVPSSSPIAKLRRVGKNGKIITVYKFRTMYSYSEYLQEYVYHHRKLDNTGKFYKDYRVNTIGSFLRKTWLDELPMVVNMLKGEMKLVGVRPLSRQFFGLYSKEMQELRIKTKPGLLPPLYYEKEQPETLEEIQESERRYCEAYLQHPLRTDWKYFWGIVSNILLKKKHSH
ncbi:MAG: sugar transferase [Bacteroidales bacterium]|nr:sugar transferase [Bacteroidales bacterium]